MVLMEAAESAELAEESEEDPSWSGRGPGVPMGFILGRAGAAGASVSDDSFVGGG